MVNDFTETIEVLDSGCTVLHRMAVLKLRKEELERDWCMRRRVQFSCQLLVFVYCLVASLTGGEELGDTGYVL